MLLLKWYIRKMEIDMVQILIGLVAGIISGIGMGGGTIFFF